MFNIVEKDKKPKIKNQELYIGDVVVTKEYKYLTVCDGYGHYSFINLNTGYIVSDDGTGSPYYVSCNNKYNFGDRLILRDSDSGIVEIIPRDDVSITVTLN